MAQDALGDPEVFSHSHPFNEQASTSSGSRDGPFNQQTNKNKQNRLGEDPQGSWIKQSPLKFKY